jgi:predicted dehydrogenase (TIGR03970 family)
VKHHDVIVIGAGSAGAVMAARLSEDPATNVLLLEAGKDYATFAELPPDLQRGTTSNLGNPEYLWGFVARATEVQEPAPLPRGKVVGGTGMINGQLFVRGVPEDFEHWVELGCDLWSFEAVLPVYRMMERDLDFQTAAHGTSGPLTIRRYPREEWMPFQRAFYEACLDAGYAESPDMNEPGSTGIGPFPISTAAGLRASTAQTHLEPARGRPNLEVRGQSPVCRLLLRGAYVTGVEVRVPGGGTEILEADHVVLSAGAIGSPHILALSGIGPGEDLRAASISVAVDLPGVGRNLRDHQVVEMLWATQPDHALPPAHSPTTQLALRYTAAGSPFANDMKLTARSATKLAPDGIAPGPGRVALVPDLELAIGSGIVRVVSADPTVQPSIELRFLREDEDRRRMRDGVRLALELARHPRMRKVMADRVTPTDGEIASDAGIDSWLMRRVRTSHHLGGTCKMGAAADPGAVVDQRGRVRGFENLRVADASVFPDVLRANTNATTILVAERMAEFMRSDLGSARVSSRAGLAS